ncbi:MAG: class I poly(R)-hydroxyalkanoic acid synthase, partial [Variibacter sp.]
MKPAPSVDYEALAKNLARMMEEGGKALSAYLNPREHGKVSDDSVTEWADVFKTLGKVAEYWLEVPARAVDLLQSLGKAYLDLWGRGAKRLAGVT